MRDKKILVTGGSGSLGSELARQLCKENEVFILDINETALFDLIEEIGIKGWVGDVKDLGTLASVRAFFEPDIVFHAAALKHVTPSAWTPEEYVKTNILGTLNVLSIFDKVINISTDKVVNPESIMGATKKVAEIAVKNANQISVRFGNVLGSRGSVIPIWSKQIAENKELTVTDKRMERYFMTIDSACKLVIEAAEKGEPGSIYILDMGKPENILDLAKQILKKTEKNLGIKMIGSRPGEKLRETLMTEDEKKDATKQDNYWIIK